MTPIGQYVLDEMRRRGLSIRQFALELGVTHPTVSRIVDPRDPGMPTLEFLVKLAKFTGEDIRNIVVMVAPSEVSGTEAGTAALELRYRRLTEEQKQIVDNLITGLVIKGPKQYAD